MARDAYFKWAGDPDGGGFDSEEKAREWERRSLTYAATVRSHECMLDGFAEHRMKRVVRQRNTLVALLAIILVTVWLAGCRAPTYERSEAFRRLPAEEQVLWRLERAELFARYERSAVRTRSE